MGKFYIKPLDGLRGIAVLLVIIFHFSKLPFISFDFEIGWVGVQLFFVLSGYLITRILLNEKEELEFKPYLKKFYWRRTLRIFPIYFLYLFFVTFLYYLTGEPGDYNDAAPYLFTYTYNFFILTPEWQVTRVYGHLWSLSVEEQFYLCWPLIVFFLNRRNLKYFAIALFFFVPLFRYFLGTVLLDQMNPNNVGPSIYLFTLSHFDAFAMGGLLTMFNSKQRDLILKYKWPVMALVILIGIVNLFSYAAPITSYEISSLGYVVGNLENYQHVWSYTLLNILFGVAILSLVVEGSKLMSNKVLVFMGRISYGMYLYHFMAIIMIEKVFGKPVINELVTFIICLVSIIGISYLSYIVIEKPLLRLKDKKFVYNRRNILHRVENPLKKL